MEPEGIAASIMFLRGERLAEIIDELFTSLRARSCLSTVRTGPSSFISEANTPLEAECRRLHRQSFGTHRVFDRSLEALALELFEKANRPRPTPPLSATIRERLGEEAYRQILDAYGRP